MPEAAATVTPEATTPQAAPPPVPAEPAEGSPPPAAKGGEAASEAEAKKPAGETPEERQKRVEAAGKRARREAAENRELRARIAQQEAQLAQAGAAQRELERLEALKKDKWAAARELGIDPRELAEQALKEGTPEYQQAQEIAEAKREAREAKETLQKFLEDQQRTQMTAAHREAQTAFVALTGDATAYPDVAKLPEQLRVTWADQIIRQARAEAEQRGLDWRKVAPTDARIAAYMQKTLAGVPTSPAKAPETESTPDAKPNGSTSPQTVTSKVASQVFTRPTNWDDLSDEQQKQLIAKHLEQTSIRKK